MQLLLTHKRQALLLLCLALIVVDVLLLGPGVWLAASLLRPSVLHSDLLTAAFLLLRNALLYAAEGAFAALVLFSWRRIPWREIGMCWPVDPMRAFTLLLLALAAIVALVLTGALWSSLFLRVFRVLPDRDVQWTFYSGPASHTARRWCSCSEPLPSARRSFFSGSCRGGLYAWGSRRGW